ncbi:MAG: type IV pilus assembly protein PilM [Candidatus Pacebacteria bacterium]|nr:type IV pilus assembly protein PilM [Candidatus Paceibacterota bacterium]
MLDILNLKPEAFGLDISDLSLKIVKLKKKGKFLSLASFGETKISPGILTEGEVKDEKKLAQIIKESVKNITGEKLKTKYVVSSLPEEKTFLQVIQMPKMKEEELKKAVLFEAENYIPLPIDQVYLDSQIVPQLYDHLDHSDVLILALPKKIVDPYLFSIKSAGLQPLAFEIESQAIARALIKNELSESPALLIDLGAGRTSFIIFSGYSLKFTSSIPISSQGFNEVISRSLGVNNEKAEELKREYGLQENIKLKKDDGKTKDGEIFEALIPSLTDLIEQIKKYLSYYQTHALHEHSLPNNKGVKKILLSGGGANLKGLDDFLSLELKIPVEVANPWVNILPSQIKELPQLPFEKSLSFTTALGLALRAIKTHD